MRNLNIFLKLFVTHIAVGLLAIVSMAGIFYFLLSDSLIDRTLKQLSSINILKEQLVANYFGRSRQSLEALSLEHKFLHIFSAVSEAAEKGIPIHNSDMDDVEHITTLYNFKNIHLFDLSHRQLFSTDSSFYGENVLQKIDSVIYTDPDRLMLIDASHVSADKQTLLFYYVPILRDSQRVGMVLVEEKFENIQTIVSENTGMGTTGESYLVGKESIMRSASRFWREKPPGEIRVNTDAVVNSFKTGPGSGVISDYRNVRVLSVYRPLQDADLEWTIISEMDWTEVMRPIIQLRYYLIGLTFLIFLVTILMTFFLSTAIAKPILQLRALVIQLSRGIIPTRGIAVRSRDEVGQMADAIGQLVAGLQRTATFAKEIGAGNFNAPFVTLSEHDSLGAALLQMRDALKQLKERELKLARARTSALLEGQENERRRIIKELHDGVGQLLTAIGMQLEMLECEDSVRDEIKKQLNDIIAEVRRISYNVMPQALVDFGLEAALRGLCDSMKRYSNLMIDFMYVTESDHRLNFDVSTALFRIAQEGLSNIVRHAGASRVNLHIIAKADEIYLALEDNGKGFEVHTRKNEAGMGLKNIQERAELLNGTVKINSSPGQGTVIEVHIPLN